VRENWATWKNGSEESKRTRSKIERVEEKNGRRRREGAREREREREKEREPRGTEHRLAGWISGIHPLPRGHETGGEVEGWGH